ncbi:hypothetical protein M758_UG146000 [Ceratodon purpureus]|nr:hypothetical protein M758_UG146000 [Ceratodon purpureus]
MTTSRTPSMPPSLSTKTLEESTPQPNDEVCLSQIRPSSETPADREVVIVDKNVIPETLRETQDDLSFPEVLQETVLPDMAVAQEGDNTSLSTKDIVPETEMDTSEPLRIVNSTLQKPGNPRPRVSPNAKVSTQQGIGSQLTRRQAALQNTLCPSPGVEKGTPFEVAGAEGSRKVIAG